MKASPEYEWLLCERLEEIIPAKAFTNFLMSPTYKTLLDAVKNRRPFVIQMFEDRFAVWFELCKGKPC